MICSECQRLGLKSSLRIGEVDMKTTKVDGYFWDENGDSHHHNKCVTTSEFTCSNGHKTQVVREDKCWCGWTGEEAEAKVNVS